MRNFQVLFFFSLGLKKPERFVQVERCEGEGEGVERRDPPPPHAPGGRGE